MNYSAKITSRGQVTLPKPVRDFLSSQVVEFEIVNDQVVVKPVKSAAGGLSEYATEYKALNQVRDQVIEEVVDDKVKNTAS